jgi:hypothetical protein
MSVHEEYLENSLANLTAQVEGKEQDRMWQSMSVIDSSSVSSYKSQDILPLRPGVSKHNKKKTTRVSVPAISSHHKERGLHRPDDWVGGGDLKKKTRKSWKVKTVRDVNLDDSDHQSVQSVPVDFGRRDPLLVSKQDSKQYEKAVVAAVLLPRKPKTLDSHSSHSLYSLLTEDSMFSVSEADDFQGSLEMHGSASSLGGTDMLLASKDTTTDKKQLDGSAGSLLSESSNHSPATRDHMRNWQSMSAVNSNFKFMNFSPEKPKNRPKWKPKPARTLPTTKVQKEKESTPAPTNSAAATPLTTNDDMSCLPDLEMSLSSLDTTTTLSSITEDDSNKMWKSMGNMNHHSNVKRASEPSNSAKHRFRAHNRPDDWLGPGSKNGRKSWTAKKIVESEDSESSATPEEDGEVDRQAEQAPTLRPTPNGGKVKQGKDIH